MNKNVLGGLFVAGAAVFSAAIVWVVRGFGNTAQATDSSDTAGTSSSNTVTTNAAQVQTDAATSVVLQTDNGRDYAAEFKAGGATWVTPYDTAAHDSNVAGVWSDGVANLIFHVSDRDGIDLNATEETAEANAEILGLVFFAGTPLVQLYQESSTTVEVVYTGFAAPTVFDVWTPWDNFDMSGETLPFSTPFVDGAGNLQTITDDVPVLEIWA